MALSEDDILQGAAPRLTLKTALLHAAPVVALSSFLALSVLVFGDGATSGPAQLALMLAGLIAAFVGLSCGKDFKALESEAYAFVSRALPAIYILLMVGVLIGLWSATGVIPTLIHYSIILIDPAYFAVTSMVLCALVSLCTGSSWSTVGTLGLALVTAGSLAGLNPALLAGAIISGAYFGDKLSPLSDTTNLAAGLTETNLIDHIRFLLWTTIPAFLIAGAVFFVLSVSDDAVQVPGDLGATVKALEAGFFISPWMLLPLAMTILLSIKRVPPLVALLIGGLISAVMGYGLQPAFSGSSLSQALEKLAAAAANGHTSETGLAVLDELLSRGGMSSFLNTIWLILSAMFLGGMMKAAGSLDILMAVLLKGASSSASILRRAGLTALGANALLADQYLSIAVTSQIYADPTRAANLDSRNLSRVIEDFGTVTSPLVPWNTCGAFLAGTLGVATLDYLPFAFFNLASPLVSLLYTVIGFKILYAVRPTANA